MTPSQQTGNTAGITTIEYVISFLQLQYRAVIQLQKSTASFGLKLNWSRDIQALIFYYVLMLNGTVEDNRDCG